MKTIDVNPEANDPFVKQLGMWYPEEKYSSTYRVHYMTYYGLMRYLYTEGRSPFRKAYLTATTEEEFKAADKHLEWHYVHDLVEKMAIELKEQIDQKPLLKQYLTQQPVLVEGRCGRWVDITRRAIALLNEEQ